MADCTIHPIPLFEFRCDKSLMTYWLNFGQQITLTGYAWYIEGTRDRILVDAGGNTEYMSTVRGMPANEIQSLDSGLSKLGVSVDDIDIVILTHLHYDHIAQVSQFPNARILVQQDEFDFARKPHPAVAGSFLQELFEGLNFEVINGDTRLCEEISVLSTPGHTPGGQSVCIKTAKGIAVIAGLCTIRENFEPPLLVREKMPVIVPGIHVNVLDAYDSLLRIKQVADIILPLHDPDLRIGNSIP